MKKMFVKQVQDTGETSVNIDCSLQQAHLKRSSSAPMINEISATMSITAPTSTAPPRNSVSAFDVFANLPRARRFSTSSPGAPLNISPHLAPRVNQLRHEECIDVVAGREAAHEKEIRNALQISQSYEDLSVETEGLSFKDSSTESSPGLLFNNKTDNIIKNALPKKIFDPLNYGSSNMGSSACSSPSPTRSILYGSRQCYSPLSPSPTRKAFATRRSLSPISTLRPSCLTATAGIKRKFEIDETVAMDRLLQPPAKRMFSSIVNPSRAEVTSGPFTSMYVNSCGSVGTPESLSSADSPNFLNLVTDENNSPSSSLSNNRVINHNDDAMSDCSNDPQPNQLKSQIESDVSDSLESSSGNDNR